MTEQELCEAVVAHLNHAFRKAKLNENDWNYAPWSGSEGVKHYNEETHEVIMLTHDLVNNEIGYELMIPDGLDDGGHLCFTVCVSIGRNEWSISNASVDSSVPSRQANKVLIKHLTLQKLSQSYQDTLSK